MRGQAFVFRSSPKLLSDRCLSLPDFERAHDAAVICEQTEGLAPRVATHGSVSPLKMSKPKVPPNLQIWIEARKRFHLSHAHIQMARELGMNPKKLGGLANHQQEPWKAPLPDFIDELYEKRFGRNRPERMVCRLLT